LREARLEGARRRVEHQHCRVRARCAGQRCRNEIAVAGGVQQHHVAAAGRGEARERHVDGEAARALLGARVERPCPREAALAGGCGAARVRGGGGGADGAHLVQQAAHGGAFAGVHVAQDDEVQGGRR
jgi:hypothetical protein